MKRFVLLIVLFLTSWSQAILVRPILPGATYKPVDLYPVYRDGSTNQAAILKLKATLDGYINLAIAHEGTCDVYLDGVLSGSVDALGSELVTNGDFATDTAWSKDNGWTIADGRATYDGTNGTARIYQAGIIPANGVLQTKIDVVSNQGSGANSIFVGAGDVVNDSHLTAGSYTWVSNVTRTSTTISIYGRAGEVFVIDNVSVKQVGETSLYVQQGQTVDIVFSDPASVTYFEQSGVTLSGSETQFNQLYNLDEYYWTGQVYGLSWDESADTYVRTNQLSAQSTSQTLDNGLLPIQAALRRCVLSDAGVVQYYLDANDSTLKADGVTASDLTGADGQVMVEIPAFYYRYSYAGTTHTWDISFTPQSGFNLHPAFVKNGSNVAYRYIGAYEGVGWDASASDYIDSGNVAATGWSGTAIDTANDKLSSVSGKCPVTDETRAEFRAIAANRGTGWRQQDYDLISAIQLLYLIEYADWDSQAMIGYGRTQLSGGTWVKDSYIGVTGKSNGDGNGTNSVDGNTNDAYMTYRGIENFFGNIWKWVDGININDNVPYVSNTDTDFADDTASNYTDLNVTLPNADGYQKTLGQQGRGFLPASIGGASNTYVTDYYYQNIGWRVVALGGYAGSGASAGFADLYADSSSGDDRAHIGSRLCF